MAAIAAPYNMMSTEEKIKELLERYVKGECTDEECQMLESWYEALRAGKETGQRIQPADEDRLWTSLLRAIEERERPQRIPPGRRLPMRRWRAAAIWIGLIILSGWGISRWQKRSQKAPLEFTDIKTGYEQVRKVVMPDSSIVWLNSASHLSIHPDFRHHRELRLEGEAFFDVRHDAEHPFVVQAGNASTTVFGTTFNISAYPTAHQLRISLQSGRIGVAYQEGSGKARQQVLAPGELLIYDKEKGTGVLEHQQPGDMNAWTGGRLIFFKTPIKEALAQIEARYGIPIVIDHTIANQTITARYDNAALESVLHYLSFGWELHFERVGDTLHVR